MHELRCRKLLGCLGIDHMRVVPER
jgi:hypothetical protein